MKARALARQGRLAFGTIDTACSSGNSTDGTVHVTDASNASRTMLYNLRTGDWDAELLKLFKLLAACYPRCAARVKSWAKPICLAANTIAGIAGDQQAALFGQCCTCPAW